MNKDVIYIDIEDDITAVIAKVKSASSKIVALVPPKRAGVLQSIVNLKLLKKAAEAKDKHIVLITNDHSLIALAAGIRVPVAKNLQSRPEVPEAVAPESDQEEVIHGDQLPVGELDKKMGNQETQKSVADKMEEDINLADAPKAVELANAKPDRQKAMAPSKDKKGSNKLKIPDFAKFRNKIFIFGGIGIVVIAFLVWALVFAPHATVKISAQTIAVDANKVLTLNPAAQSSDPAKLTLKPIVEQIKKTASATFTATGKKDIGNKASGTINIVNCDSSGSFDIPAGSIFTADDGHTYTSNAKATVPGYTSATASACNNNPGNYAGKVGIPVTATAIGDEYNIGPTSFTINIPVVVKATSSGAMAGGSHQMATVVSQEDVNKAKAQITPPDENEAKNDLKKQFPADAIIIQESFSSAPSEPKIEPAVGEAAQQGKVTVDYTYTYYGLQRNDVKSILNDIANGALQGKSDQQLYDLGDNTIAFQNFTNAADGTKSVRMLTTEYIGPKIDTGALAKQLSGKRYGEIQNIVNQIPGVKNVEVNMSPFWVNTAPAPDKIDIIFTIGNGN